MGIIYNIKKALGYHYLLNKRSKEVHDISDTYRQCCLDLMNDENKQLISRRKYNKLLKRGLVNSCHWCLNDNTLPV